MNLGLRLRGRRSDGYHLLESLMVPLDLCDRLEIERVPGPDLTLTLEGEAPGVPLGPANLAVRAAQAFLREARLDRSGRSPGLRIRLHKRIPAAAGLGGGSSDAGAMLRALGRLFPGALDDRALHILALRLGADVPFFLDPRPAFVAGIGEVLEAAPGVPALPLLLANPGEPLSTARVFALADELAGDALTPRGADPTIRELSALPRGAVPACEPLQAFLRVLRSSDDTSPLLTNDLERAAVRLCPAVAVLRREIERVGAVAVGLSGSGPTVFGVFASVEAAGAACERLALSPPARSWVVTSAPSRLPESSGASPNW